MGDLTIKQAQERHPWNVLNGGYGAVPYSEGVRRAEVMPAGVPHIQGSHAALHAAKSVGKLAAVFEALDHEDVPPSALAFNHGKFGLSDEQRTTVKAMSADLLTAALRLAYLYEFDLAQALEARAKEKNGVGLDVVPSDPTREALAIRASECNRVLRLLAAAGVTDEALLDKVRDGSEP